MAAAKFLLDAVLGDRAGNHVSNRTPKRPPPLETVPAGALLLVAALPSPALPSPALPSAVPVASVGLAGESGDVAGEAIAEESVPVRTRRSNVREGLDDSAAHIDHRAAFVLMHVDGISEIGTIAELVSLPIADVLACFAGLVAAGLVELTTGIAPPVESGVFPTLRARA